MSLVPTLAGDIRPTCDEDGVHSPLVMYFEGHAIRCVIRPNLPADLAVCWVMSDSGKALGYAHPWQIGKSLDLIEGEDRGEIRILTPGGPQKIRVLTWKGLSKFLMRSDKETAIKFQDVLAAKSSDLTFHGIAFRDGSVAEMAPYLPTQPTLSPALTVADITQIVGAVLGQVLDRAIDRLLSPRTALAADTRKRVDLDSLPEWSDAEYATMKRQRELVYVPDFLFAETGQKAKRPEGLTRRIVSYCKENGISTYPYRHHGSIRYLVPLTVAKLVYRSGWSTRNRVDVMGPALFSRTQGEVIELASRRSS